MTEWFLVVGTALWLGILTSISPCPLATNIAAVSYISRRVEKTRLAVLSGLLYTAGRMATYLVLGVILSASILAVPQLSYFLQKYMNMLMGPLLIIVGMFLLEFLTLPTGSGSSWGQKIQGQADKMGVWGAGLLGIVFALSFCPTSAALFFGSLIPLTVQSGSSMILPSIYGLGTALPVLGFALVIAFGAKGLGSTFNRISAFELWARRITGGLFIAIGVWMSVRFILMS
ncbi:MAG: sulfite exporter TauE/SafE family protein [Candidatus Sumerlaeia bacterium]|nr:sulfite exporter TauE/SafE family protein [Candidatus Sumerlaeia bacterium]